MVIRQLHTSMKESLVTYTTFMTQVSLNPPEALFFKEEKLIKKEWESIKPALCCMTDSFESFVTFFIEFSHNLLKTVQNSQLLKAGRLRWQEVKNLCSIIRLRCLGVIQFLHQLFHEIRQCWV